MSSAPRTPDEAPTAILFTDLDGTLLDFETYRPSPRATDAIRQLHARGVAVIPVSSKTAAEVLPLRRELGLTGPAVTEGGGVIVDASGRQRPLGLTRRELTAALDRLRHAGFPVRGMSEMAAAEVAARTGLTTDAAERAMSRRASEPFIIEDRGETATTAELDAVAARHGASVVRGGRFWHLLGRGVDKAVGVREVLRLLGANGPTAAVGDAWNDLPMLAEVDHGFLLGDEVADAEVPAGVLRIGVRGPEGFARVVERLKDELLGGGEECRPGEAS